MVASGSPLGEWRFGGWPQKTLQKQAVFAGLFFPVGLQRNPGSFSSPVRETLAGAGGVEGTNIITKRSLRLEPEKGSFWPRLLATKPLFAGVG